MPFRQSLRLRPVKSEKEELTWSFLAADLGTVRKDVVIAKAVDSPTAAGQVEVGDTIKSFYIEFNVSAETITNTKVIHWMFYKLSAGQSGFNPNTYDDPQKRTIHKRGMEMVPKSVNTIIKRIFTIRVPSKISRMGDGDQWILSLIVSSTESINWCGIGIFRHFG